ncbi:unnamed protein product [Discula destructiva]
MYPSLKTAVLGLLTSAAIASASDVLQLTQSSFSDYIKENDIVLAEFFAPWCGHCKALAPEYEEAATTLKEKNIKLVKVDCTEESDLCQEFGVEGYPTLKVFRGLENHTPYKGQRKAGAIVSYMTKQSLPAVSIITSETFEDFKKADKVVIVGYFESTDKAANETFSQIAEKLRDDYPFAASSEIALAQAEVDLHLPSIVLYKDFDEGKAVFEQKFDPEEIEAFIKSAATPLIGEVGPETYSEYMSAKKPLAYIFAETAEERKELSEALTAVAKSYRGRINFATIDAKQFGAHAVNLNLKEDVFPSFAIQDVEKNLKFPFDHGKKITERDIKKFVDDFHAGKIEPSIKSEEIPEDNSGPVTVVVAKNYDDIILDDTKDVLIEFYAPWCGHCKALAPKYEELGQLFAASEFKDKVTIAKVDATANDVPDEVNGFPSIKLYPAGDKKNPVDYSGSRTVEDLIEFIAENGKHKAKVSPKAAEEETPVAPAATEKAEEAAETKEPEAEATPTTAHDEL